MCPTIGYVIEFEYMYICLLSIINLSLFKVPIINEDINKQKNIDPVHQPPFSDAYLNGMPKKRRLEHKPDDNENPDAKLPQ